MTYLSYVHGFYLLLLAICHERRVNPIRHFSYFSGLHNPTRLKSNSPCSLKDKAGPGKSHAARIGWLNPRNQPFVLDIMGI